MYIALSSIDIEPRTIGIRTLHALKRTMKRIMRAPEATLLVILLAIAALPARAEERLRMSTTTSTENSGLLSVLLPPFEKKYACKVDVVAVGTGKALKLGEAGDVDVVFVHARSLEDKFMANGYGADRRDVMYNDFVTGPEGRSIIAGFKVDGEPLFFVHGIGGTH